MNPYRVIHERVQVYNSVEEHFLRWMLATHWIQVGSTHTFGQLFNLFAEGTKRRPLVFVEFRYALMNLSERGYFQHIDEAGVSEFRRLK